MAAEASSSSSASSQWVQPSFRPQHIEQLITGVDRYNPQNLEILHDYLGQQLDSGTYDCLANLAILKLYQFNPADFNYAVVINVLCKALTSPATSDFNLCLALLGEAPLPTVVSTAATQDDAAAEVATPSAAADVLKATSAGNLADPLIRRLAHLSGLLSSAHFREFWTTLASSEYEDVRGYTSSMVGFDDTVRFSALNSVKAAFRTISAKRLGSYLALEGSDLSSFISQQEGWKVDADTVLVPANLDNEVRATVIREDITLDQLSKLIAQSQPARLTAHA